MTSDGSDGERSEPGSAADERGTAVADRRSPVGKPVIRGDPSLTGQRAEEAVEFDPEDPESLQLAAETVGAFSENTAGADDNVYMLRGAAACAALVRGEGSYKAAAERAGASATVSFIRKWSRVHDLPNAVRRHVAMGQIPPTAAKHIARIGGEARLHLAWALLDHDLTVRQVRSVASDVNDGESVAEALRAEDVELGRMALTLDTDVYCKLRRTAALDNRSPGELVSDLIGDRLDE
jgi:hypothetical protein